MHLAVWPQ